MHTHTTHTCMHTHIQHTRTPHTHTHTHVHAHTHIRTHTGGTSTLATVQWSRWRVVGATRWSSWKMRRCCPAGATNMDSWVKMRLLLDQVRRGRVCVGGVGRWIIWKYWQSLNLSVCPQTKTLKILAEFKIWIVCGISRRYPSQQEPWRLLGGQFGDGASQHIASL